MLGFKATAGLGLTGLLAAAALSLFIYVSGLRNQVAELQYQRDRAEASVDTSGTAVEVIWDTTYVELPPDTIRLRSKPPRADTVVVGDTVWVTKTVEVPVLLHATVKGDTTLSRGKYPAFDVGFEGTTRGTGSWIVRQYPLPRQKASWRFGMNLGYLVSQTDEKQQDVFLSGDVSWRKWGLGVMGQPNNKSIGVYLRREL